MQGRIRSVPLAGTLGEGMVDLEENFSVLECGIVGEDSAAFRFLLLMVSARLKGVLGLRSELEPLLILLEKSLLVLHSLTKLPSDLQRLNRPVLPGTSGA